MKYVIFIALVGAVLYLAYVFLTGQKYRKSLFGQSRIDGKTADVPLRGNVFANWYVEENALQFSLRSTKNERNLLCAFILKWILEGRMTVIPDGRRRVSLRLSLDTEFTDRTEMSLYEMLIAAAGKDAVLESKEFRQWARHEFEILGEYPRRAEVRGRRYLLSRGWLGENGKATPEGMAELRKVIEFRNQLGSLTTLPREALWKDYLVLGALFGRLGKMDKALKTQLPGELLLAVQAAQLMADEGFTAAENERLEDEQKRNQ
ncbi:MAG: hypothetical protein II809_03645 [Bacteroidales bacterium]|nr:hypothetical protein [Bacteroidales bacterium]